MLPEKPLPKRCRPPRLGGPNCCRPTPPSRRAKVVPNPPVWFGQGGAGLFSLGCAEAVPNFFRSGGPKWCRTFRAGHLFLAVLWGCETWVPNFFSLLVDPRQARLSLFQEAPARLKTFQAAPAGPFEIPKWAGPCQELSKRAGPFWEFKMGPAGPPDLRLPNGPRRLLFEDFKKRAS